MRDIEDGQFAVPKLQRAFVWNGTKAALLLDSVVRGLPVGVITVWNARQKHSHQLPNTLHVLPQPSAHLSTVKFVLDGQQRLSVLYHVLTGTSQRNARGQEIDFSRVVLHLRPAPGARLVDYRKPVNGEHLSLCQLLSGRWRSKIAGLRARDRRYATAVRSAIRKYRIGLTIFETQNLHDARELFIRINSSGTPLASSDRAFARAQRIDLRAKTKALHDKMGERFAGITNETILQTLALASGIEDVGARAQEAVVRYWEQQAEERGGLRRFDRIWTSVSKGLLNAADTLQREFGVKADGLLPSQYMLATLAMFHARRRTVPSDVRKLLRAWFWGTALSQRYSGRGFRTNVLLDAALFKDLAAGRRRRLEQIERVQASELVRSTYGARSSISDALTLLLVRLKPLDLLYGHEIQLDDQLSASSKTHRHHVFPRRLLKRNKVSVRHANSIVNLCLVSAGTNSQCGSRRPWDYLSSSSEERWYQRMLHRSVLPDLCAVRFTRTNIRRAYSAFLSERTKLLVAEFERAAGRRLFSRD